MSFICKVLKIEFFMSTKFSHLWKLFTDIQSTAVPYRGGFRSPRYRTAADFCQISKRRSPWYRTAADFDRRGTVPRRISIAAVPYPADCCEFEYLHEIKKLRKIKKNLRFLTPIGRD